MRQFEIATGTSFLLADTRKTFEGFRYFDMIRLGLSLWCCLWLGLLCLICLACRRPCTLCWRTARRGHQVEHHLSRVVKAEHCFVQRMLSIVSHNLHTSKAFIQSSRSARRTASMSGARNPGGSVRVICDMNECLIRSCDSYVSNLACSQASPRLTKAFCIFNSVHKSAVASRARFLT